jgi:hypothetical protein
VLFRSSARAASVVGVGTGDGGGSEHGGAERDGRGKQQGASGFNNGAIRSTIGFSHGDPSVSTQRHPTTPAALMV